ncbi:MAG: lipoyl(octanoyl) transferase LipB [Planctomycetota bacterium]|nr:lipoyl(octanoyl) transferase LipB [Planctomycetota bacterium]
MRFSRSPEWVVRDLGRADYAEVNALQEDLIAKIAAGEEPDHLLLAEFEPVITIGRGGGGASQYAHLGVPVHEISRGGKATFHGPGQLVAYPLLRLEDEARDLHAYLHALEDALIGVVSDFGLQGGRDPRNTGCWVNGRKLASIGVAVRRWVSWHGLALNVSTDLDWFRRFDPCGLDPEVMTTMAAECLAAGRPAVKISDVSSRLVDRLAAALRNRDLRV